MSSPKIETLTLSELRDHARALNLTVAESDTRFSLVMRIRDATGHPQAVEVVDPEPDEARWTDRREFFAGRGRLHRLWRRGHSFDDTRVIPNWVPKKYDWKKRFGSENLGQRMESELS